MSWKVKKHRTGVFKIELAQYSMCWIYRFVLKEKLREGVNKSDQRHTHKDKDRPCIHDNQCDMTIKSDTGQHSHSHSKHHIWRQQENIWHLMPAVFPTWIRCSFCCHRADNHSENNFYCFRAPLDTFGGLPSLWSSWFSMAHTAKNLSESGFILATGRYPLSQFGGGAFFLRNGRLTMLL